MSVTVTVTHIFIFTSQIGTAIKLRSAQDKKAAWRDQLCSLCVLGLSIVRSFSVRNDPTGCTTQRGSQCL